MSKDSRAEQLLRDLHYHGVYIAPDVANRMIEIGWSKDAQPDNVVLHPGAIQINASGATQFVPRSTQTQNIFHRYNR